MQRAWLRRGPVARLLWPVSLVYRAGTALHRRLYASGRRPVERLPVPVIVVGNVIAGGAGKTPVVLALLQHLRRRRVRAGVVSRGHGRSTLDCREVRPQDDPVLTGDEPLLLRRNGGLPVFVARRRAQAARALLAAYPGTQVIVSDDGLQHHALARDIEICVFDRRGIGNGLLLPAGPMREHWPRPVDLVLRDSETPGIEGHVLRRTLATEALRGDGARRRLADLRGVPVIALAGIASPEAFFDMLRAAGLTLTATYGLPDHHDFVHLPAAIPADACLLCTEKDAVKLWALRPDAWAVPLQVEIPQAFWDAFDRLLDAQLSSAHGSSPA
nr:tetraacyldisaccharide 4'-kinase [Ramlibacter alkalitolerans]